MNIPWLDWHIVPELDSCTIDGALFPIRACWIPAADRWLFASYGIECKVQVETQVSWSICAFVEEGLGVALIDPITAHEYKGTEACFQMFEPLVTTDFSVPLSAQHSPSILLKAFVTHTRAFALVRLDPRFVAV